MYLVLYIFIFGVNMCLIINKAWLGPTLTFTPSIDIMYYINANHVRTYFNHFNIVNPAHASVYFARFCSIYLF